MKNLINFLLAIPFVLCAGLLVAVFVAKDQYHDSIRQLVTQPELISTHRLLSPEVLVEPQVNRRAGTVRGYDSYWAFVATDDWMLLNGTRGAALCPALLPFADANVAQGGLSVVEMRALATAYKDVPLQLMVYVPRFQSAPRGLDQCTGVAYDGATRTLRMAGKRIAFLAPNQPRLAQQNQH